MKSSIVPIAVLLGMVAGGAHGAGDAAAGRLKAETCTGCHSNPGWRNASPPYQVPKIGGQHAEYIVSALKAYRDGQRPHSTMHAQAATLSEQDMADIAAYFAGAGN